MGKLIENQLGVIIMLGTLLSMVLGAFIYMNSQYADASDFQQFKEYSQREFTEIRIERIVNELNNLTRREASGFMTKYDKVRKEELEREWKMLKGQKNDST